MDIAEYAKLLTTYSLEELKGIERRIDKSQYSERFAMVQEEIECREQVIERRYRESFQHAPLLTDAVCFQMPSFPRANPYAGLKTRLGAQLLDIVVTLPCLWLVYFIYNDSHNVAMTAVVAYGFFYIAYKIYCHGRWGQTVGKMILGIRVLSETGIRITFRHAFYRYSVDLLITLLTAIAWIVTLFSLSQGVYDSLVSFLGIDSITYVKADTFPWGDWLIVASYFWMWGSILVMLLSEKHRAIHDFIAGTVVVYTDSQDLVF